MTLRTYQVALNEPARNFLFDQTDVARAVAQVYAPTGAGKTVCFIELLIEAVERGMTNIAILHPRIALSQDQLKRFNRQFNNRVHFTSFHSGVHPQGDGQYGSRSTTNPAVLQSAIDGAAALDMPHFTFSSYHSFDKLINAGLQFDIVICDEAHYLVQDQFNGMVANIPANRVLFYTATPITNDLEGTTMDLDLFGPVIAQVAPKELIHSGYLIAPLVHLLAITADANGKINPIDVIARAYVEQHQDVCEGTYGTMPYAQMLVAARGVNGETADIEFVENNLVALWDKIRELSGGKLHQVDVYTVAADRHNINGICQNSRSDLLDTLKNSNANAILIHYDTLSEGIDIDTLTGVVLMRSMNKAKILQTIGRCARPYVADLDPTREPRHELFDVVAGVDTRAKRRCIVTLPCINGEWMGRVDSTEIAQAFIDGGYDDLIDYIKPHTEDQADGNKKNVVELPSDDKNPLSKAISHRMSRQLENIRNILVG